LLLDKKLITSDILQIKDNDGNTSIMIAIENDRTEIIKL
jgi:ankyrin repeat protein